MAGMQKGVLLRVATCSTMYLGYVNRARILTAWLKYSKLKTFDKDFMLWLEFL